MRNAKGHQVLPPVYVNSFSRGNAPLHDVVVDVEVDPRKRLCSGTWSILRSHKHGNFILDAHKGWNDSIRTELARTVTERVWDLNVTCQHVWVLAGALLVVGDLGRRVQGLGFRVSGHKGTRSVWEVWQGWPRHDGGSVTFASCGCRW